MSPRDWNHFTQEPDAPVWRCPRCDYTTQYDVRPKSCPDHPFTRMERALSDHETNGGATA